jgi:putative hemolysin
MGGDQWLIGALIAGGVFLAGIAWLSALETAVRNARRSRLGELNPAAEALIEDSEQFRTSAHLAKSLCESLWYAVTAFVGMELAIGRHAGNLPDYLGDLLMRSWPGILLGALVGYFCVTLFGETFPKVLAARNPERVLIRNAGLIRIFVLLFTPVWWVTCRLGRLLAKAAGTDTTGVSRAAHSEEEIKLLVEGSAEEGVLEQEEKEMIHSIIEFTDTVARQVMVPRIDISAVSVDASIEDVVNEVIASGHSRLPVYENTPDNVLGVVHIKDLLGPLANHEAISIREAMREPYFIPEGKKLDELLQDFRRQKSQLAIVVDEFGGTSGIVTVEDVLEEIVGEIEDEYDVEEHPNTQLVETEDGAIVDARMTLADVNEELCLDLPPGDYDTVGGFVFSLFGRPPELGEQVSWGNTHFLVEALDGLRLQRIRVVRVTPEGDEEPSPASPDPATVQPHA